LSVVWSIVSSIIEKRKAAAKKEAASLGTNSGSNQPSTVPVSVKVQSLRRRQKQPTFEQSAPPVIQQKRTGALIVPLHKDECPLPPSRLNRSRLRRTTQIAAMLANHRNLRTAIVLAEVLGKPVSQRNN
jgi:hypothetical protein